MSEGEEVAAGAGAVVGGKVGKLRDCNELETWAVSRTSVTLRERMVSGRPTATARAGSERVMGEQADAERGEGR